MATRRKTYKLRGGDVYDVEEYPDGRYGAKGKARQKKKKPTPEQMAAVNQANRAKICRRLLIEYFDAGDYFVTYTYKVEQRPKDMTVALKDLQKALRKLRPKYKKANTPFYWIRNIERGTKGAWHIHLVIKKTSGAAEWIEDAWEHGAIYITQIKKGRFYDEDFTKLANYMTKNEKTREKRSDGSKGKPRLKEASYNHAKNMPLPEPKSQKLVRWQKEVKPKKGYYIANSYEGINPATGMRYRRYTLIRIHRRI